MDIAAWLQELGLERYEQAFRDNDVDAKVLPHLTAEDLKDIGITSVGHHRTFRRGGSTPLAFSMPPRCQGLCGSQASSVIER